MWEFIVISIISVFGAVVSIQLLQHNWFKREEIKYKYDLKRAKSRAKNIPVKQTSTPSTPLDWITELRKLNPETLHTLIDTFGAGEREEGEGIESILGDVVKNNPELVQQFLSNLQKDNKSSDYLVK